MKTKKFLKNILATMIVLAGISFSQAAVQAVDWGVGVNSTGGVNVGIGSSGSGAGAVWGSNYGGGGAGWSLSNPYGLPQGSLIGIISNLLFWLLMIFAIMGIIGFVLSGIFYLLAGADEDNAKKGKAGMKYSIIGIIVGLSGYIIMQAVTALLSGNSNKF